MKKREKRLLPLPLVFFFDFLLFCAALPLFALFHHVLPHTVSGNLGIVSPKEEADWGEKFPGVFAPAGTEEQGEDFYRTDSFSVTVTEGRAFGSVYHLADVYVRRVTELKTAFAGGAFARGYADSVINMAKENSAVFAVSGDYYGIRDRGIVVRNGVVYRDTKAHQIAVLYYNGALRTYPFAEFRMENVLREGPWQIWDFGPLLLKDGKAVTEFNTGIAGKNPRMAFGAFEEGHYCFVAVDGRQSSSAGMTLPELAQLMEDLGCKTAYNFDGGHSAVMVLNGRIVNSPSKAGGRDISDIVYLAPAGTGKEELP